MSGGRSYQRTDFCTGDDMTLNTHHDASLWPWFTIRHTHWKRDREWWSNTCDCHHNLLDYNATGNIIYLCNRELSEFGVPLRSLSWHIRLVTYKNVLPSKPHTGCKQMSAFHPKHYRKQTYKPQLSSQNSNVFTHRKQQSSNNDSFLQQFLNLNIVHGSCLIQFSPPKK